MERYGYPPDMIQAIQALYKGAVTNIRIMNQITDKIPIKQGTLQGDTL